MTDIFSFHYIRTMRNNLVLFLLCCLAMVAQSQELSLQTKYKNHFEVKPLNLLAGQYNINYERVLGNRISAEISYGHWFGVKYNDGEKVYGNNVAFNPRFYFTKQNFAPESYYFGPYFNYNILENKNVNGDIDNAKFFEKGLLIGRQWLKDNGIVFDINAGIAHLGTDLTDTEIEDEYEDGIPQYLPKVGLAVGYSF